MSEHTKGPWRIAHDNSPDWTGDWYIYAGQKHICNGNELVGEELANARLIAAAPELLEALSAFVEYFEADFEQPKEYFDALRVIAKAESK